MAGSAPKQPFLCTDVLLGQFGTRRGSAQAEYRAYVEEGLADALEADILGERLGEESFLRERFGYDPPLAEIPREQVEPLRARSKRSSARAQNPSRPLIESMGTRCVSWRSISGVITRRSAGGFGARKLCC